MSADRAYQRRLGRVSASDPAYGWVIVTALGVTEAIGYGVLSYGFGVLIPYMRGDLGWSMVSLSGAYSLAVAVSGVSSVVVGRMLDRADPRLLMGGGSVLAGCLVLAWSVVVSQPQFYLVFACMGVAMALVLYDPAFIVVTHWFADRRHSALAALTTIAAFSSLVFSPLASWLAEILGWRAAVAALGLILLATTAPIHLLVLRAPPREAPPGTGADAPPPAASRREAAASPAFWLLATSFALGAFSTGALCVHLVALLVLGGSSAGFAALAMGVLGVSQIPGRVLLPSALRFLGRRATLALVFGATCGSIVLLRAERSEPAVLAFAACFGTCNGMLTLLRPALIGDLFGRGNFGAISGLVSALGACAAAAAPLGAALIASAPGGYDTLLIVLAVTSLAAGTAGALALGTTCGDAASKPARSRSKAHSLRSGRDSRRSPRPPAG